MPNYIRAKFEGGFYFFTVVTYDCVKLFNSEFARQCLRDAIRKTQSHRPYETVAFCLLPDHLHRVWKLPEDDSNFSKRWSSIKGMFSKEYLQSVGQRKQVIPIAFNCCAFYVWHKRVAASSEAWGWLAPLYVKRNF